ncbi:DUF2442 domain-containing protein [Devosia sp. ZB163]|jgi:hypothetical protein|uniref:DUF2442 domain-containing protein n=1 Tax=Devosia sp. ZB163 TaxID=3025938 RepID=UPI00235E7DD1|nr:DUF2442 domain-containing protein [Devosia sp. ZB163]MDC9823759.1 DUF2442 domain-containing protein [Devosia sp. ZB163]
MRRPFPTYPEPRAASVQFVAETGMLTVVLKDGDTLAFKARDRVELASMTDAELASVTTDRIGFYIEWPASNVSLYVPALVTLNQTTSR